MFAICQSVPGPTSTQLLILICIYISGKISVGIIAFIIWSLPSYLILTISAKLISKQYVEYVLIKAVLSGFRASAVAIILDAFWKFSKKYHDSPLLILLILGSASLSFSSNYHYNNNSGLILILILFLSGIIAMLFHRSKYE